MDNGVRYKKSVSRVLKTSNPLQTLRAAGTDPGFVGSEACIIWEPLLKRKNTKLQAQN